MKYWSYEINGGTDPYLSKPDEEEFITILIDNANDLSCLPTFMAIKLAHNIKKRRYKRAISLLLLLKCERLIQYIDDPSPPSKHWLINLAHQHNLQIKSPQIIEIMRRLSCNYQSIEIQYSY